MKKTFIYTASLLAALAAFVGCEKQTMPDPVRIQYPDRQSPFVRDDAYYARLRAYKRSDHKLAFGWFGSWTAIGASEQSRLRSAPDSMDIISMWSQWHSLSKEQIEDKAFVQRVKGTKVVFCISAKDMPDEFKVDGEITEEGIVAYAKAWGKDSMDKYQYDGIDIDFETAVDHTGPMNTNPANFKKFAEELSRYIGPKSGTGRLFLIDGNVDASSLPANIGELCDYAVSQAYSCSGASNLRTRTASAAGRGWRPEQMIFTENFESLWQSGGANYSYDGETIPSLLGMAHFAAEETAAGFGSYHMEYEYGHADMPYKYMRQAIQIANPAPQGDYSKNLLTLHEAGEREVRLEWFPSGKSEAVAIPLTASLANAVAAATEVPMRVDNGLVAAYNDYYYTEYEPIDPSAVSFTGPFRFAAGAQVASEEAPVQLIVSGAGLEAGKEYLAAVRADFSGVRGLSANTAHEVLYVKVTKASEAAVNEVAFADAGQVETLSIVYAPDGTLVKSDAYDLTATLAYGAPETYEFALKVDDDLIAAYNAEHGTSYLPLDAAQFTAPAHLTVGEGMRRSDPVRIECASPATLALGSYLLAFRMELPEHTDYEAASEEALVKYVVIDRSVVNVLEEATAVDGTAIADKTGWTYKVDGTDYSADVFNGNSAELNWWNSNATALVEVDMGAVQTICGWRMACILGNSYYANSILRDVAVSSDGATWESQAAGDVKIGACDGPWQYLALINPVECRYIRMTYVKTGSFIGCCEFEVYAPNN